MATATDATLVTAAQAGDERALALLIEQTMPVLYGVVGKALRGGPDVDDVVQETMFRVVRGLPTLRDPERFRAWAITIAYHQLQDRGRTVRAATALGPLVDDVSAWPDPTADVADSTVTRLHLADERREANEAGRMLSAADQHVMTMWWREMAGQLSRAELASALGVSTDHAAVRVQRAKAHLALARAVVRAWHAKPRCRQLDAVAHRLGGPTDPRWLRRLGRHVRRCDVCASYGRDLVPAEHLLAGAGVAPVLFELLRRPGRWFTAKPALLGGAAAVTALTAVSLAVYYVPPEQAPAVTAPPVVATGQPAPPVPSGAAIASATPAAPGGGYVGVTSATYVVAPGGSDDNPGSLDRPFATVAKAVSLARRGQTIALRGGVYELTKPLNITISGTASKRIVLSNYRGERPILDGSRLSDGAAAVTQRGGYWTVQGLEIRGAPGHGYLCHSCGHDIFRALSVHDNGRTGLMLRDAGTVGNQILDSDLFGNHDDAAGGENGDGLGIEYGSGNGNVVRGCRLYRNSDDGLGLHEFTGAVTIDSTWSFENGVNRWGIEDFKGDGYGFKLGGGEDSVSSVDHVITNSAAWDNATYGFTESGNHGKLTVERDTAFRNGKTGFAFADSSSVVRHNVAVGNGRDQDLGGGVGASGNSWAVSGWTGDSLRTADPSGALAPRRPDGHLPAITFLTNDRGLGASMGR